MVREIAPRTTIIIPEEVDAARCYGDTESGISFEIKPERAMGSLPRVATEALVRGERVFVTKADDLMFLMPEVPQMM